MNATEVDEQFALGNQLLQQGRFEEATACYRRVIELAPHNADAHNNLGNMLKFARRLDEAIACYERAASLAPEAAEFHNNLGTAWDEMGRFEDARRAYQRALALQPTMADAHYNLGNAYRKQGFQHEAIASYLRAVEMHPQHVSALSNLGKALREQGRLAEAEDFHRQAIVANPHDARSHYNLGTALAEQGDYDEAQDSLRIALKLDSSFSEALHNLGLVRQKQGHFQEAAEYYERALALKPDSVDARWNQATLRLLLGDMERGWEDYEWRWRTPQVRTRTFTQPSWNGEPLSGKTILLHSEQGLGDAIQFVRYAPLVKSLHPTATVVVECEPPLLPLLKSVRGVDAFVVRDRDKLPTFHTQAPLISLPRIFRTRLNTIPQSVPYLFPDTSLMNQWRQKLSEMTGLRVGINWRGRRDNIAARERDFSLEQFSLLTTIPGVHLISLQRGYGRDEWAASPLREKIIDLGDNLDTQHGPFMDTAAVMMNLDLVITNDTSIAHLAGALGTPVWVALQFVPDWRWLLTRSDSPWYPTMRLFRQQRLGDWSGVFEKIQRALRERASKEV